MRKIAYISGTRADFGLMKASLEVLNSDARFKLEIIALGQHIDPKYGDTINDIYETNIKINKLDIIEIFGGMNADMAHVLAIQTRQITSYLEKNRPNIILLLGDRSEMLAAGIAALFLGIPVAHFHGGDRSGTVDDQLRQAITALAHYHFPATLQAKTRLLKMGELNKNIHMLGAPGLDEIYNFIPDANLSKYFEYDQKKPLSTILFHPVVQDSNLASEQAKVLIETVSNNLIGTVVVLAPNSDAGSSEISAYYEHVRKLSMSKLDLKFVWITHLPRQAYLSLLAHSDLLLGNSSSGVIEAASLKTTVVNIGDRQNGRERNDSIFDCEIKASQISDSIKKALQYDGDYKNLYDHGGCAARLPDIIQSLDISEDILKKRFSY